MGIELPGELAEVAEAVGLEWPQADEDALLEQAGAWREAERQLSALASEADVVASEALTALSGDAGELARRAWAGFADADTGQLVAAARGAGQAASRLEHAAAEIGAAKVEMVRQLVDAAKNRDAALAAADAGHPAAALGVDTVLTGLAANLGAVSDRLTTAIGPGDEGLAAATELVDPNPGAHLRTPLSLPVLSEVDGGAVLGTGPIALPPGEYQGLLPQGGFEDVPTPPSGLAAAMKTGPIGPLPISGTTAAAFAEAAGVPGAAQQVGAQQVAPQQAGVQPPVPPQQVVAQQAASHQQASPHQQGVGHQPVAAPQQPVRQPYYPPAYAPQQYPPPGAYQWGGHRPAQQYPYQPYPHPPQHQPHQPPQQPPLGTPRKERESIVALFLVHMFPIGHLPVASDRPARQLPLPARGFPPHDHPESHLIDTEEALAGVRAGRWRVAGPPGEPPALDPVVTEPDDQHPGDPATPDDRHPSDPATPPDWHPGDPVVLAEGTLIDRFGTVEGRIFAADGLPYHRRALPLSYFETGYRRYRVCRALPMWAGDDRYRALYSADELVTLGYLADITFERVEA
ncbi:TNT domain-containing protein [Amycolatopsis sp. 195334CR]|uniref:TNT domain-containing protein n=1 Tax=Amycolatopsis sp. 195334CR TaxID=2814588 RepID=UPI001A8E9E7B|nr:TNT domain-containing protein [Amycolatopsis sp. 195334CR]MBN6036618.1 glycohydrolase toxin TNT-related protein [Amycolatopsis sp. 195334CR]